MYVSRFQNFTDRFMYELQGIKYCEPMTAKEIEKEEDQDLCLNSPDYYVEEKFDGTRATLHFFNTRDFISRIRSPFSLYVPEALAEYLLTGCEKDKLFDLYYSDCTSVDSTKRARHDSRVRLEGLHYILERQILKEPPKGFRLRLSAQYLDYENDVKMGILLTALDDFLKEALARGALFPQEGYARCFSRRVSVKTDWFVENSDSVPQLRDLNFPELAGTVIDGEMFIPGRPFSDVSSTLNCSWEKAVKRQEEIGYIVFHAFDILYYKGIRVEMMPLWRRKQLLQRVVETVNSPYIKMVDYYQCNSKIHVHVEEDLKESLPRLSHKFPNLVKELSKSCDLSPKAYYEYIVATGGEGVILKPITGKYYHKRGREYQKIKKFLTREVLIMGFTEPTKEYKGKFPKDRWEYWLTPEGHKLSRSRAVDSSAKVLKELGYTPVSKFWYEDLIGNIRYGVIITEDEIKKLPKNKKFVIESMFIEDCPVKVIEVGECAGFDEEQRKQFSCNAIDYDGCPIQCNYEDIDRHDLEYLNWVGTVIEVKANELFKDTGKMRHPRFLRIREDKNALECTWRNHIE